MATFFANPQIYWLAIVLCLKGTLLSTATLAQAPSITIKRQYKKAQKHIKNRQFGKATKELDAILHKDNSQLTAHLQLLHVYEMLREEEAQIMQLQAMLSAVSHKNQTKLGSYYLQLVKKHLAQGKYTVASTWLQAYFAKIATPLPEAYTLQQKITYATAWQATPSLQPTRLSQAINGHATQYFPSLTLDGAQLLFTARSSLAYEADEDLYLSRKDHQTGKWTTAVPLPGDLVNSPKNEGAATLSADGHTLIFTACQRTDGLGSCDLYISQQHQGKWTATQPLDTPINTAYWESQPALSVDGRTLYFSSNRPGGLGARDLWYSIKDSANNWTTPRNMGMPINTVQDEIAPFIHANGYSLYFSSDGHMGMGGFDIFLSELNEDGNWQTPRNLGYPLNNWHDQVSFITNSQGTWGYYTHEEQRQAGQKVAVLYKVQLPQALQVSCKATQLHGSIRAAHNKQPLQAQIKLFVQGQDSTTYQLQSNPHTGQYVLAIPEGKEYVLYASATGYLPKSTVLTYSTAPQTLYLYLERLLPNNHYTLEHIYFTLNSYALGNSSLTALKIMHAFMVENPKLHIEIAGHTDNSGSYIYNQQLSERRARTIYTYLKQAGIAHHRLQYKGHGELHPQQPNTTTAGRSANRRITFRILEK